MIEIRKRDESGKCQGLQKLCGTVMALGQAFYTKGLHLGYAIPSILEI